jgi:hypothetical protein
LGARIAQWNSLLPQHANDFSNQHSNISVAVYDLHTLFITVLNNPTKYGFANATAGCHTGECIWVDEGPHSTYAMHKIIAADMVRFLESPTISTTPTSSPSSTTHISSLNIPSVGIALVIGGILVGILSGR